MKLKIYATVLTAIFTMNTYAAQYTCEPVSKNHEMLMEQENWNTTLITKPNSYEVGGLHDKASDTFYPFKINMPVTADTESITKVEFKDQGERNYVPLQSFNQLCNLASSDDPLAEDALINLGQISKSASRRTGKIRSSGESIVINKNMINFDDDIDLAKITKATTTLVSLKLGRDSLFKKYSKIDGELNDRKKLRTIYYLMDLEDDLSEQAAKNNLAANIRLDLSAWPLLVCDLVHERAVINVRQKISAENKIVTVKEVIDEDEVSKYYSELKKYNRLTKSQIRRIFRAGRLAERMISKGTFKGVHDKYLFNMFEAITNKSNSEVKNLSGEQLTCTVNGIQHLSFESMYKHSINTNLNNVEATEGH